MKTLFTILIFFLFISIVKPQSDSLNYFLSDVVVTANRVATPSIELANSVSIITKDEIQNGQKFNVADLLQNIPGITVFQQGTPGGVSSVFTRGSNTNHTLVMLNGIELNDPGTINNGFDFSQLQTNNIERIEVLRGPQSTLYGSDAMAGVINIITQKPSKIFSGNLSLQGGTNSFYRGTANLSGTFQGLEMNLNFSRLQSKGFSAISSKYGNTEKDGYNNNSIYGSLGYKLSQNLDLDLFYIFTKFESDLDQSSKTGDDPNYKYNLEEQLYSGKINTSVLDSKIKQKLGISYLRRISKTVDLPDQVRPNTSAENYSVASRMKLDFQNDLYLIPNNIITFGISSETEKAFSNYFSESSFGPYESIFPTQKITTTGIYVQDQFKFQNSFFTTVGFRFDNHEKFGKEFTYRIAPAYFIGSTGTKLKMTYGTAFKSPSLFQLYDPSFGNANLKPEKSKGYDAGIEQFLFNNKLSFEVTYFSSDYSDLLGYDENFVTTNVDKVETHGVEFSAKYDNSNNFYINLNYTYTSSINKSKESPDYNKQLIRRPNHQASITANYKLLDNINLNADLLYVGERNDRDFSVYPSQRVTLSDYLIFNFSAKYRLNKNISVQGRIENLFDKYYEDVLFYGSKGRAFYLGLNLGIN